MRSIIIGLLIFLAGCVSVPNSAEPRFYMLESSSQKPVSGPGQQAYPGLSIAVGPVIVPDYLDRPQIVTQDKDNMLSFAQFDRWGEPLDDAFRRVVIENLFFMLPGSSLEKFPYNHIIPVKYQVAIEIVKVESNLHGDVLLVAQWSVIDVEGRKMLANGRSEFKQPVSGKGYAGIVKTLSSEITLLSSEIAKALQSLEGKH